MFTLRLKATLTCQEGRLRGFTLIWCQILMEFSGEMSGVEWKEKNNKNPTSKGDLRFVSTAAAALNLEAFTKFSSFTDFDGL